MVNPQTQPAEKEPQGVGSEHITQELYKRNAELAYRNKTLLLLRKMYSITLATLDLDALGAKIAASMREDLDFEMVSLFVLDPARKELTPFASAPSPDLKKILDQEGHVFHDDRISLSNDTNACVLALRTRAMQQVKEFWRIWDPPELQDVHRRIQEHSDLATILIYPLFTDEKDLGVLVIGMDRQYDELVAYEKEILESLTSVISIAIDKSNVYEQLKKTNGELRSTTQQLSIANADLKKLDEAKSEFLSIASHQLLTPLTPIQGYASMMLEGDYGSFTEEQKKVIDMMKVSAQRLIHLVDDLLNISRIESGRVHYEFKDGHMEDIVAPLVEELKIKAKQKGVQLSFASPKKQTAVVVMDEEKMRNVLMNLIDNSLKYGAGTESVVSVEDKDGKVLFAVRDKGMGISEEDLHQLFHKFSRGSDATKIHTEGTGLGLYVAKQYVEAHHGRIWAESAGKGKGSQFYVEMPVATSELRDELTKSTVAPAPAAVKASKDGGVKEGK